MLRGSHFFLACRVEHGVGCEGSSKACRVDGSVVGSPLAPPPLGDNICHQICVDTCVLRTVLEKLLRWICSTRRVVWNSRAGAMVAASTSVREQLSSLRTSRVGWRRMNLANSFVTLASPEI